MILLETYYNHTVIESAWYRDKGYFIHPDIAGISISSFRHNKYEWIQRNNYQRIEVRSCNY